MSLSVCLSAVPVVEADMPPHTVCIHEIQYRGFPPGRALWDEGSASETPHCSAYPQNSPSGLVSVSSHSLHTHIIQLQLETWTDWHKNQAWLELWYSIYLYYTTLFKQTFQKKRALHFQMMNTLLDKLSIWTFYSCQNLIMYIIHMINYTWVALLGHSCKFEDNFTFTKNNVGTKDN